MMTRQNNNWKILGILFLCEFGISAIMFLSMFLIFGLSFILAAGNAKSNDLSGILASSGIVAFIFIVSFLVTLPIGIAGWTLFKNKPSAKVWGTVASVLSIFFMCPLGLIVSILGFVFLFGNQGNQPYGNIGSNRY